MFGLGKREIGCLVQLKQSLRGNVIPVNKCIGEKRAMGHKLHRNKYRHKIKAAPTHQENYVLEWYSNAVVAAYTHTKKKATQILKVSLLIKKKKGYKNCLQK